MVLDIQESFINKNARGKGYGTELINRIISYGRKKKFRIIFLDISPNNKKGIRYYQKIGFKKVGEIDDFFKNKSKAIILSYKFQ